MSLKHSYIWLVSDERLTDKALILTGMPALALVGSWVALCVGLLIGFHHFNWGQGTARFFLLFGLGVTCVSFTLLFGRLRVQVPSRRWIVIGLTAVSACLAFTYFSASAASIRTHSDGSDPVSDQAQNCYRAITLLKKGVDPYGRNTFLDPDEWHINGPWMAKLNACLPDWDYASAERRMREFWATLSLETMNLIVPEFPDSEECREWARRFHSLGYKYGPLLLVGYWPFVEAFGQVGILVSHLVFFVAAMVALFLWMRARAKNAVHLLLPIFVILGGSHIRGGVLSDGHSDLLPTIFAAAFLILWIERKHRSAAVVLGLCVAAKTFPGMIYAPLLLRRPRDIPFFFAPLAATYLPFLFWDPVGLWYNFSYPLLYVRYDAGSIGYAFMPGTQRLISLSCVATACGFLGLAFLSKWNTRTVLLYLVAAHLAVFCAARMFHNNYLTWLAAPLPLLIFWSIKRAEEGVNAGMIESGKSSPASARP